MGTNMEVSRVIKAPRNAIYQAFVDQDLLVKWLPPGTMTGKVHVFEPRVGGKFRIALTYQHVEDSPDGKGGKSSDDTDISEGIFAELVPDEKIVWVTVFDSPDPQFAGEMTITTTLNDTTGGTEVTMRFDNLPDGIRPEDNEMGARESLEKLAALVE